MNTNAPLGVTQQAVLSRLATGVKTSAVLQKALGLSAARVDDALARLRARKLIHIAGYTKGATGKTVRLWGPGAGQDALMPRKATETDYAYRKRLRMHRQAAKPKSTLAALLGL